MRGVNLVKLLRAVDLISRPQGATVDELQEHLEVGSRSSVYRLTEIMEELGFPLIHEKIPHDRKKRIKLLETFQQKLPNITLPDIKLTLSEITALHLLRGEDKIFRGTEIEETIDSALKKIGMFVPEIKLNLLRRIKTLFALSTKHAKNYSGKEDVINCLTQAILQEKTCAISYYAFTDKKEKSYEIDPLSFFENEGGLYVFARISKYGDIRTLAVERIKAINITDKHFDYPHDFDPEERLSSAFNIIHDDPIEVKVWFDAEKARYIKERVWAKDQKITDESDGSIVLEMQTSGLWEIMRWVLSFGSDAEVLEPKELRDKIVEEINWLKVTYFD